MNSNKFWTFITLVLLLGSLTAGECRSGEVLGARYVVAGEAALLRDYPSPHSGIVSRLHHQDQVEYLESNASGWWKVRSLRTAAVGWMTADLLTPAVPASPPAAPAKPGHSYAATPFDLRIIPLFSAAVSGSVKHNDRLEKLGDSPAGWTKVRNLRDGSRGWLPTRYVSPRLTFDLPRVYSPKKRVRRSPPAKIKKKEETAPASEEAKPM